MARVAVVTGASAGLGLSFSRKWIDRGGVVFGVSKTKKHWPHALDVIDDPHRYFLDAVDLTSESAVRSWVKRLTKKIPQIDIVISNAGYGGVLSRVEDLSLKEFEKHLAYNLTSAFLLSKHIVPILRKQKKGQLIYVSSMAGKRAVPQLSAYSASKFGVVALAQAVAKENADAGLKAFAMCPGGMNTEMRAEIFGKEDASKQQSPDFVADVILQAIDGSLVVESGGDVVVRHGKITAVNPAPGA